MSRTDETFQERSPSKERAPWNMWDVSVTDDMSQEERSPSKERAPWNMWDVSVTDDMSQEEMSRRRSGRRGTCGTCR